MCSYRVSLTVGHECEVRGGAARYCGGAHDWRLYVRGAGGEDISRFVSKIVFTLHRSYTYPKRVIHEPPYEIRESGYGSFEIPIYVYIKHSTNPSKIKFRYKLAIQNHKSLSGSQKFSHVFDDPPEPVRTCLIEGGAKIVESKIKKFSDEPKYTIPKLRPESRRMPQANGHLFASVYETDRIDEGRFHYATSIAEDRFETDAMAAKDSYHIPNRCKGNPPEVLPVSLKMRSPKEMFASKDKVTEERISRHSKSKHRAKEIFEGKCKRFCDVSPVPTVLSVNLDRVGEEHLKRRHYENVSVNSKRRRTVTSRHEIIMSRGFERNVKKHYDRIVDVINDSKSDAKVRNMKSEVKKEKELPQEGEKLTEATVVDSLKKACKFVEMSSSDIGLVSDLYLSLCMQQRGKRRLKLPSFSDPMYRPELPPSLRGLVSEMDYSDFLR